MRDGYLRGQLSRAATQRQMDVFAACVAAMPLGIRSTTVKRHLADLQMRLGLNTEQLICCGRAQGWLGIPGLEADPGNASRLPARLGEAGSSTLR